MSYRGSNRNPARRAASVIVCVLVVLLLVGMLSVQTLQTLMVIRRSDNQRAKIHQARELIEVGQQLDWKSAESQSLTIEVPDSTNPATNTRIHAATLERRSNADSPQSAPRIVACFPADEPGEVTTTGEVKND